MKKFVGFYYRCSFKVCLCALLSLIGLMVLSSPAFALQSGDFTYTVSGGTVTITQYIGAGGDVAIPSTINGIPVVSIYGYYEIDAMFITFYGAFEGSGVTSVTIPSSVTSIVGTAFADCNNLTSIVVDTGDTAYSSQDGVLYNKAKTVLIQYPSGKSGGFTIPDSVTTIGYQAFSGCSGLTSVTIPDSVASIGSFAFRGCSGLTSVTIPNSVTNILDYTFSGCSGLTSVTIGTSVTGIGSYAFWFCSGLTSVTIPNSVTSIGNYAFQYCSGLTSVTIGNGVTSIGHDAFSYCSGLTSIVVDPNNPVYSSQDGVLYNKAMTTLIQYPGGKSGGFTIPDSVTSIGGYAFYYCISLTSVTIGNSVTSIGSGAFYGCYSLISVTIPNSVTSIGNYAFQYCNGLTSVTIGNGVTSIGLGAFSGCSRLTSVTIPDSVTSIGNSAFYECDRLTSVTIPDSVTSIEGYTFYSCYSLTSIVIPNSVKSIGFKAFQYCRGLTSVTIGNSVTSIGDSAFYGCSLTNIIIPNSVKFIEYMAFSGCSRLTSVTIPSSVTSIGSYAFQYCRGLTTAYFNGNAPSMGSSVFNYCASNFSICYTAGATGFTTPTWYGYPTSVCVPPTVINLSSFTATPKAGKVILQWNTGSETDNAGFNIYRATAEEGEYTQINTSLIPAKGTSTEGASYEFIDNDVQNRKTYYYKLEDIDLNGTSTMHGPVSATPRWILGIFSIFRK